MVDVLGEHGLEMTPGVHKKMVEALSPAVLTQRSANAFALGERTGVRTGSASIEAKTASKLVASLRNPVSDEDADRYGNRRPASSRSAVKLRATCVTHAIAWLVVTPRRCTTRLSTSMMKSAW
jgi:hypothetical protein